MPGFGARAFHLPTAASVLGGCLGAGVLDAVVSVARAHGAGAVGLVALSVGLYGAVGFLLAAGLGWAVGVARDAVPPVARPLSAPDDGPAFAHGPRGPREELDRRIAAGLLVVAVGGAVVACGVGVVQLAFVSKMASARLAALAAAGLAMVTVPVAVLVALAIRDLAWAVARRLPRPRGLGTTGFVLAALAAGGVLAGFVALSRADWRVLDLAWLGSLLAAAVLGVAHGCFWYVSSMGRRLHPRVTQLGVRLVPFLLMPGALVFGAHLPDGDPAFQAAEDHSLGLRPLLALARRATDRDGDGHSARFGGGDCDDRRGDVHPGAEDVPGDGVDGNCEGGDAQALAEPTVEESAAGKPEPVAARADAWTGNLLVVSIDTLRADRLGIAGYERPSGTSLTPTLDELAKRGAYFRRVWAQAPNTPRSFPSLLTSRPPADVAWQKRSLNYSPILDTNETFFETLARGGWKAIGLFSHFYFDPERNLGQGFAEWSNQGAGTIAESNKDVASPRVVPKVIERLRRAAATRERFVLWTHLFEPHASYVSHAEFPTSLGGVAGLEEKYDFEIAFADRWLGKIVAALKETGLDQDTAILVHSDHGEAWGEHGHYFHGQDLTEEQLRVPLILVVPGRAPVTIDENVALVDVGPTLLDLVGLPVPSGARGRSLVPLVDGKPLPPRPVFSELLPATAWPKHETMVVDGPWKLTHRITERRWLLHDLAADPKQQRDLAGSSEPRAQEALARLKQRLLQFEEQRR